MAPCQIRLRVQTGKTTLRDQNRRLCKNIGAETARAWPKQAFVRTLAMPNRLFCPRRKKRETADVHNHAFWPWKGFFRREERTTSFLVGGGLAYSSQASWKKMPCPLDFVSSKGQRCFVSIFRPASGSFVSNGPEEKLRGVPYSPAFLGKKPRASQALRATVDPLWSALESCGVMMPLIPSAIRAELNATAKV